MALLSRLSFRYRVVVVATATAAAALLLAFVVEAVSDLLVFRREFSQGLVTLAKITGDSSRAALVFGDNKAAGEILRSLQARPDILAAELRTTSGTLFASYRSDSVDWAEADPNGVLRALPAGLRDGVAFEGHVVNVAHPILFDDERVGTLVIRASTAAAADELLWRNLVWFLGLSLILAASYLLARRLERTVSRPILALARTAREVTRDANYSLRASVQDRGEIGRLVDDFNEMLSRVQTRDRQLEQLLDAQTAQRRFLQNIIDAVPDPILVVGMNRELLLTNEAATRLAEATGTDPTAPCFTLAADAAADKQPQSGWRCPLDEIREQRQPVLLEQRVTDVAGRVRVLEISAAPLVEGDGHLTGMVEAIRDITERRRMELLLLENQKRLDHLAHHDSLTDLPNRLLFQDRFEHALRKAERDGSRVALLFLDLDRFKNINDTFGHEVGDRLLKAVSGRLGTCVRSGDTVARLGGDEFAVVLEDVRDSNAGSNVARKIIQVLADPFRDDELEFYIGVSIGISMFPEDGADVETLTKSADSAMYHAKEEGRGGFQYFTRALNERAQRRLAIEINLRRAIERRELEVHYQPQVDLARGCVVSAEALLRWHSPELGRISPAEFIPVAEDSGLIVPIGEWVLETACRQALAWERAGLPPLRVAVNLSGRQFRQKDLIDRVASILSVTGLDPSRLDLELTESVLLGNSDAAHAVLSRFRELGVNLSIDDFGTGYSSLSYLNRFPLDYLKVAQEFVRAIPEDAQSQAIARAIVVLARNLGLKVVVEGVETAPQLRFFSSLRCEYVQGYYFSRPLPAHEFVRFMQSAPNLHVPDEPVVPASLGAA